MSFVSVVIDKFFCSVMTDGRVCNLNGDVLTEDFKKFRSYHNDSSFIAFSGTQGFGEYILDNIEFNENRFDQLSESLKVLISSQEVREQISNNPTVSVNLIFGGLNSSKKFEIYTWDSKKMKVDKHSIPNVLFIGVDDVLLESAYSVYKQELNQRKHVQASDYAITQEIINNFIADKSQYVNKNTYQLIIKRS
ncbi:hypothetical protein [Cohnella soli]|uniref:Uncharacterized protein n=1 Tax=Cohnella soli TaxID=425005 RepID=A0ABW0HLS2_9BACL